VPAAASNHVWVSGRRGDPQACSCSRPYLPRGHHGGDSCSSSRIANRRSIVSSTDGPPGSTWRASASAARTTGGRDQEVTIHRRFFRAA
jgi:hypothetical protein